MPELTLIAVDPRELLLDLNVRGNTRTDPDLVESIRDVGVLQPVTVVRTTSGQYRVRYGNRRTLGAIEADQATIPAIVAGDEDDDQAERIVRQLDENERREALTPGDRVRAVQQLAAFGISANQIAKRTRTKRAVVDAAVKVGGSELATAAADRYGFLDLEQAAVIAEFEDDPDVVKMLVAGAKTGQFDHVAQRARDDREANIRFEAAAKPYVDRGLTVVDAMFRAGANPAYLEDLRHRGTLTPITDEEHEQCPGHAIALEPTDDWFPIGEVPEGWTEVAVDPEDQDPDDPKAYAECLAPQAMCLDWIGNHHHNTRISARSPRNGNPGPDAPVDEEAAAAAKEAASSERRRVIRLNKAWDSAEQVRRKFLRSLLARKTPPKGAGHIVASNLIGRVDGDMDLTVDLLGLSSEGMTAQWGAQHRALRDALKEATEQRAQVIALALIIGGLEANMGRHTWRSDPTDYRLEYFAFLTDHGYPLSEVEQIAIGQHPLPDAPTE